MTGRILDIKVFYAFCEGLEVKKCKKSNPNDATFLSRGACLKSTAINTLGELLDRTTPAKPDPASGRLRQDSVYRGVANDSDRLLTSLDRLGGCEPAHIKCHLEEHLLRNFLRYGHAFLPKDATDLWELMVAAEHHGLPTRLLDWTHSPLIAAHFATLRPAPAIDRVVWKLNWKTVHRRFRLKELAFLVQDLEPMLKQRGFPGSWDFLNAPDEKGDPFVCLLEPTSFIPRLEAQSGAFTLASSKQKSLEDILTEAGIAEALERFVIPAGRVDFMRDQLDICTIDERHLFAGLDGIAAELRRYYSASGPERETNSR